MVNNKNQKNIREIYLFQEISFSLNKIVNIVNGGIVQKGIFPTNINRGIKVYIYSGDHLPIHFHVKSEQRYLDAKFQVDPLNLIKNNTVVSIKRDINFILKYFKKNEYLLDKIKDKFIELNPQLKYE